MMPDTQELAENSSVFLASSKFHELVSSFYEDFFRHFFLADLVHLSSTSKNYNRLFHELLQGPSNQGTFNKNRSFARWPRMKREQLRLYDQILDVFKARDYHFFYEVKTFRDSLAKSYDQHHFYRLSNYEEKFTNSEFNKQRNLSQIIDSLYYLTYILERVQDHETEENESKKTNTQVVFGLFATPVAIIVFSYIVFLLIFPPLPFIWIPTITVTVAMALIMSLTWLVITLTADQNIQDITHDFLLMDRSIHNQIFEQESLLNDSVTKEKNNNRQILINLFTGKKFIDSKNPAILAIQKELTVNPNISATALFKLITSEIKKPKEVEEKRFFNHFFPSKAKAKEELDENLINLFKQDNFDLRQTEAQHKLIDYLENEQLIPELQ